MPREKFLESDFSNPKLYRDFGLYLSRPGKRSKLSKYEFPSYSSLSIVLNLFKLYWMPPNNELFPLKKSSSISPPVEKSQFDLSPSLKI